MKDIALHVGRGTRRQGLTVFPIWQERAEGRPVSIADDQLVRVGELAQPSVPYLQVTVTSPVDLMAPSAVTAGGTGRIAQSINGPLEFRGIRDGECLRHASVINTQVVAS